MGGHLNEQNLRYLQVQSPEFNCRIYYMITIDTSSPVHFFASKNHINLCRLHVYSCYIYVVTLKCILSHWSIYPRRCSTISPMLSLKVNHKCLINTIVPIKFIIWLGFASTSKWYHGIFYLFFLYSYVLLPGDVLNSRDKRPILTQKGMCYVTKE